MSLEHVEVLCQHLQASGAKAASFVLLRPIQRFCFHTSLAMENRKTQPAMLHVTQGEILHFLSIFTYTTLHTVEYYFFVVNGFLSTCKKKHTRSKNK